MSWVLGIGGVLAILLALLALQPVAAQEGERQDLVIVGAGTGVRGNRYQTPPPPNQKAVTSVRAAVIDNPNISYAAEGVTIRIDVYGSDVERIGSSTVMVPQVLPGERRAVTATEMIETSLLPVVRTEATIESVARWVAVREMPLVKVSGISGTSALYADRIDGSGATVYSYATATIENPLDAALGEVQLVAVAYDRAGRITGGAMTRVPYLAAGGSTRETVNSIIYGAGMDTPAGWGRVEVYAAYPWIDLTPYRR